MPDDESPPYMHDADVKEIILNDSGACLTGGFSGDEGKFWKVCPQVASRERGAKGCEPSSRCQDSFFDDSEAPRSLAMGRGRIFDYDLLNTDRSRLYEVILYLCRAVSIC